MGTQNCFRNSADPFVLPSGGLGRNNDVFFTRLNEPHQDDMSLGNELKDLSGVVSLTI